MIEDVRLDTARVIPAATTPAPPRHAVWNWVINVARQRWATVIIIGSVSVAGLIVADHVVEEVSNNFYKQIDDDEI